MDQHNQTRNYAGDTGADLGTIEAEPDQNVSNFERGVSLTVGALLLWNGLKTVRRRPLEGISRAFIGYTLVARGVSGTCPLYTKMNVDGTKRTSVNIRTTFTVNKPREEVYAFWRNLENLPRFMNHLSSVQEIDHIHSHWEARIPKNNPIALKWDAEIIRDEPGTLISWHSLPGSTLENAGKIEFRDALGHHGCEIRVIISYRPPAGNIGSGVAHLLNPLFEKMVKEDVMSFKEFIEFSKHAPIG